MIFIEVKKHDFSYNYFKKAWDSSNEEVPKIKKNYSWEKFLFFINSKRKKNNKEMNLVGFVIASFLICIISYSFLFEKESKIKIENLSQLDKKISLPDGSSVLLEPSSEILYCKNFQDSRNVKLKGKALFKVVELNSKEFKVETKSITTRVLGTTFSIREKEKSKDVEIRLYKGRIAVSDKHQIFTWNLIAGEKLLYKRGKVSIEKFNPIFSKKSG